MENLKTKIKKEAQKAAQLSELDFDNLSEVLENLVKDIKRSGESYLKKIIRL